MAVSEYDTHWKYSNRRMGRNVKYSSRKRCECLQTAQCQRGEGQCARERVWWQQRHLRYTAVLPLCPPALLRLSRGLAAHGLAAGAHLL